jgi:hypothetical protein
MDIAPKNTWLKGHGVSGFTLYPATPFLPMTFALASWHAIEKRALDKRMKSLWVARRWDNQYGNRQRRPYFPAF